MLVFERWCIDINLFIVSNIGQLYQAQALIRKEKLDENVIAILYTNLNTTILDYLIGSVDNQLFTQKETVLLPNYPNKFSIRKLRNIKVSYEKLVEKYSFNKIFLCSYETHYNYFKDIAKENGIELNLFEEGTATYKFLIDENVESPTISGRFKRAFTLNKNDLRRSFESENYIIKPLKILVRSVKRFAAALFTKNQREKIKLYFYPEDLKSAFQTIDEFDEVFVAFPEKAKLIFKAKKYNELISDFSLNQETTRLINESYALEHLNEHSVVFVNQRYNVPHAVHVDIIISFLKRHFTEERIFIKFHPKDSEQVKQEFEDQIKLNNLNAEIIDLDIEVPFEAILKVKRPKMVVGISSTSLIYTEKILPGTKTLSCAHYYISHLVEQAIDDKVVNLITYHKKIMETMSDIEIK